MSHSFASFRPGSRLVRAGLALMAVLFLAFQTSAATALLSGGNPSPRSFAEMRAAAEKGDAIAQRLVANAYLTGEGVKQDQAEAVRWVKLAAEQRDPIAQYALAGFYEFGQGVTRSMTEAAKWYERAAQQGLPEAQFDIAICYRNGEGVPKDSKKAFEWFRRAAEQGDARSQCHVGLAYVKGNGVEKNYVEAASWFRKAAYQEDASAQFLLGRLYQLGTGATDKPEPESAVKWFRKAAALGHADAQYELGCALLDGKGVTRNPAEGRQFIEAAAAQRHELAMQFLAQGTANVAAAPAPSVSPMIAAASGQLAGKAAPPGAFAQAGNPAPFTAPQAVSPLPFTAPVQETAANPNPALKEPTPAIPALPAMGKAAELPPFTAKTNATDTTAKEPSLPPFTAPPLAGTKESPTPPPSRDLFSLPPGSADTNAAGMFTEPPRSREPQTRVREDAATPVARAGGESDLKWIAIISALISAAILFLGIYMLYAFQTRLRGLEAELKKAQFELSKANVNLSAMMHQVEQLALAAPAAAPKTSLPEWNPEPAKAHASSFKMSRSK